MFIFPQYPESHILFNIEQIIYLTLKYLPLPILKGLPCM